MTTRAPEDDSPRDTGAPPVLVVLSSESRPRATLLRAHAVAAASGAGLIVVVCLPEALGVNGLFPPRTVVEAVAPSEEEKRVAQRVWLWCNDTAGATLEPADVVTGRGRIPACATAAARRLRARLIVLGESDVRRGSDVTAIVEASGVPVLVSRPARQQSRVLAATDLEVATFPVLQEGAALARALGAPLSIVHNVAPRRLPPRERRSPAAGAPAEADRSSSLLAWVVEDLGLEADARVTERTDTADAVLELARLQQADLVVVGHRRRSWIVRWLRRGVAERVIDGSRLSVAVVPLNTAEEGSS